LTPELLAIRNLKIDTNAGQSATYLAYQLVEEYKYVEEEGA